MPGEKSEWKIAPEDVAEITLDILRKPSRTLVSRVEVRPRGHLRNRRSEFDPHFVSKRNIALKRTRAPQNSLTYKTFTKPSAKTMKGSRKNTKRHLATCLLSISVTAGKKRRLKMNRLHKSLDPTEPDEMLNHSINLCGT